MCAGGALELVRRSCRPGPGDGPRFAQRHVRRYRPGDGNRNPRPLAGRRATGARPEHLPFSQNDRYTQASLLGRRCRTNYRNAHPGRLRRLRHSQCRRRYGRPDARRDRTVLAERSRRIRPDCRRRTAHVGPSLRLGLRPRRHSRVARAVHGQSDPLFKSG